MKNIEILILMACRMTAFIALCPVFSYRGFPNLAKVIVGVSLIIAAFPTINQFTVITSSLVFGLTIIKEVLFGIAMGYLTQLVFSAVQMAGSMIDFQAGFTMAQAYDPTFQVLESQFGKLYYWLAISVIFLLNLHQRLILGVITSFNLVPLGVPHFTGADVGGMMTVFGRSFAMALNLAAPLVVGTLMIDLLLGVLSRSIPQINVLMLSLPIKTLIVFAGMMLLLPNVLSALGQYLPQMVTLMQQLIHSVGGA